LRIRWQSTASGIAFFIASSLIFSFVGYSTQSRATHFFKFAGTAPPNSGSHSMNATNPLNGWTVQGPSTPSEKEAAAPPTGSQSAPRIGFAPEFSPAIG
jgi:hypothetical protein